MDEYISSIIREFNHHKAEYEKVVSQPGKVIEESFHAFMMNAISAAVRQSSHEEYKIAFYNGTI